MGIRKVLVSTVFAFGVLLGSAGGTFAQQASAISSEVLAQIEAVKDDSAALVALVAQQAAANPELAAALSAAAARANPEAASEIAISVIEAIIGVADGADLAGQIVAFVAAAANVDVTELSNDVAEAIEIDVDIIIAAAEDAADDAEEVIALLPPQPTTTTTDAGLQTAAGEEEGGEEGAEEEDETEEPSDANEQQDGSPN